MSDSMTHEFEYSKQPNSQGQCECIKENKKNNDAN
jgi:hypothetical protein